MEIANGSISLRRFAVMLFGIALLGLGVTLFKLSLFGNDPSNAMAMAIGDNLGLGFALTLYIVNGVWFLFEILFGRKYVGVGTFANWFGVGAIASIFTNLFNKLSFVPAGYTERTVVMVLGVLILSLACSLYQTANVGISPYDSVAVILHEKFRKVPYSWFRIVLDSTGAAVTYLLGGIVGLGTLVCAIGLGPFISFFDAHISRKLCGIGAAQK